jgi:hypothetical protein
MQERKSPAAVLPAGRAWNVRDELDFSDRFAHRQSHYDPRTLRRIARTLRDDGFASIRIRLLAFNAARALARGRIDPDVASQLVAAYRIRRAVARVAARAYR